MPTDICKVFAAVYYVHGYWFNLAIVIIICDISTLDLLSLCLQSSLISRDAISYDIILCSSFLQNTCWACPNAFINCYNLLWNVSVSTPTIPLHCNNIRKITFPLIIFIIFRNLTILFCRKIISARLIERVASIRTAMTVATRLWLLLLFCSFVCAYCLRRRWETRFSPRLFRTYSWIYTVIQLLFYGWVTVIVFILFIGTVYESYNELGTHPYPCPTARTGELEMQM